MSMQSSLSGSDNPTFADLTTIGVGGTIARFVEPNSRVAVIEAVEDADCAGLTLCVIGGGSNMLVSDESFNGVVVRDARREICVLDEAAPSEDGVDKDSGDCLVHVSAEAGCNWDDFVSYTIQLGLEGVEALSGIPGTVGASVVQNIGAYGSEVAKSVESVEVWDRKDKTTFYMNLKDLKFGYRTSVLKQSMYRAPGVPADCFFPTPRYVVLSVTFCLKHSKTGVVAHSQLAHALGVQVGDRMETAKIRREVLRVRASKGMLEDAMRYANKWMCYAKNESGVESAISLQNEDYVCGDLLEGDSKYADRHSCGSFFMNPILTESQAELLPEDAPRFDATLPDGSKGVKTSAAWLIDHSGFHKGFRITQNDGIKSEAGLSSLHTLALTNRNNAKCKDIVDLARKIIDGVYDSFGVKLVPEPVLIGINLDC
ncbi:UDP-N-acetylenolpyruvoylglucosamine reductase [Gardnerella vaginalis 55152]|uniref:UDP-N-acetylenolpyruvoylglucosamine reductase n=1 Tax=Gardnerella vaginalis 55152 TaxID=698955 RepID=I4LRI9_GARVA|nr:FAD-binding protein [Gardnerella vaginalis]EIK79579.1 UDP-N-acetylenolpyruvoylglucosamine reductase [Gardnerella vaginalis 55152]